MKLIEIENIKIFNNLIKKKNLSVIYFYSTQFPDITNKIVNFLKDIYNLNIQFYSINIKNEKIIKEVDLTTFPVLRIYKNNELIKEIYCSNCELDNILKNIYS